MQLNHFKIGHRLAMGFGAVLALTAAITLVSTDQIGRLGDGLGEIVSFDERTVILLASAERATLERAIAARNLVLLGDDNRRTAELTRIEESKKQIDVSLQDLQALIASNPNATEEDRRASRALVDLEARYWPIAQGVVELAKAGKTNEAMAKLVNECIPVLAEAKAQLGHYSNANLHETAEKVQALRKAADKGKAAMMLLGLVVIAVGCALAWLLQRSVVRPLSEAGQALRHLADGDLTKSIQMSGRDEVSAILGGIEQVQQSLRKTISTVRAGIDSISTASSEIATGNQDLSTRTEQTASNLQQTASSMEQLTGTVKQTADSARTANQLASSAQASAAKGGQVVSQVVSTMEDINASSKKIADIIGVIDGIAFQTNILALNAAVEAARAGEQGRGFAVVASEVRSLAQRSANAAKEIKGLIGASVEKVESGSKLVADAGQTMSEIVGNVQRVSDIIGEITAAAAEQSDGIGQVNAAVNTLDQMTQQNAALVEQSAAAAESLKDQAAKLSESVSAFRVGGQPPAARPQAPRLAPPAAKAPAVAAKAPLVSKSPSSVKAQAAMKVASSAPAAPRTAAAATASASAGGDWETF